MTAISVDKNSDLAHEHNHDLEVTEASEKNSAIWLFMTFIGGALILNSYIIEWTYESGVPEDDRVIGPLCALIGAVFLSAPLILESARNLLAGRLFIGELAALAVLACFAIQKYQEAGLIAFFLMLAELLEHRTALGAQAAVESLIRLTPNDAHLVEGKKERDVAVSDLKPDDVVRVRPGENIPVDGVIIKGETTINQASVTGESLPIDKMPGDQVFAGTVNLTGAAEIKVTRIGADTTLGKVKDLMLQAESTRLPIMRLIDTYIKWYTPTVLMISALIGYFTGSVEACITALVVSCPCALVLATPTAMVAGLSCAARLGIMVKNVAHLESAADITAVVFDKTGTLTTGELTVTRLCPAPDTQGAELLRLAASADRHSNHPAARALLKVAKEANLTLVEPEEFREISGKGVTAKIDGKTVLVGRATWLQENNVSVDNVEVPSRDENDGFTTLYAACDNVCLGWVGMMDRARPEARQATETLLNLGIHNLTIVTGDRWGVARRVAADLGCTDVVAECLPERKLQLVESMKKRGLKVAVVGDGVNDAPALAAGDLGVAMGAAGNDVAIHSASIALMSNDLGRLPFLIRLSRNVRRIVAINLAFGAVFVIGGLALSATESVYLTPVTAAILHNVGSLIVIFNSARIVRQGEELHAQEQENAKKEI